MEPFETVGIWAFLFGVAALGYIGLAKILG
jgi:hypothetical protein